MISTERNDLFLFDTVVLAGLILSSEHRTFAPEARSGGRGD